MHLSFTTMATPDHTVAQAIALARRFGYEGIDLRVSDNRGELSLEMSGAELRFVRRRLDDAGLLPAGLLCYNDREVDDEAGRAQMAESILAHLKLARTFGSPSVRVFTAGTDNGARPDRIAANAEAIAAALRRWDGPEQVLIQHHAGQLTALEAVELIKGVEDPRAGLIFSPDHCLLQGEEMEAVYAAVPRFTRQIYLADLRLVPGGYECTLPGQGEVPLAESCKRLRAAGFDGWVSFKWEKIWHPELPAAEEALPYFIDWMGKAL